MMITDSMIQRTETLLEKIHQHPFNRELMAGVLSEQTFAYYLYQDALYLADYSRALSMAAARLQNHPHVQQYIQFALGAIEAERELHFGYIKQYQEKGGLSQQLLAEPGPACFMYTNYLLRMASMSSIEEAVASLLPCFYVYKEVGKRMIASLNDNHPYADWILLYSGEAFETSVQCAMEITNELGDDTSDKIREKMVEAFVRATQLEWLFWDSAYRKELWLIYP